MNTEPLDENKPKLRITIPDGSPEEQIAMIESMKEVVLVVAEATGETVDTTPFDDALNSLKKGEK